MAYKVRDLIVTVIPSDQLRRIGDCEQTSGGCDATSGGCGGTCDAGSQSTTGSCSSEGGCGAGGFEACGFSDEFLDPLDRLVDPGYMIELRMLVRHAVARSRSEDLTAIEAELAPKTRSDVELLERHLTSALDDLRGKKERLS
jgi:hypothetical protein